MLTLLSPPRRAWLTSFWLAICCCSGLIMGILSSLLITPRWFILGIILAIFLALPGLIWPQKVSRPYMVWNKLARDFGNAARVLVMGICFYIVFVAVGRTGSTLTLARPTPTDSLWVTRGTLPANGYASQYGAVNGKSHEKGWFFSFLDWVADSGNFWAISLLPFLILLSAFKIDQKKKDFPANIYTLF